MTEKLTSYPIAPPTPEEHEAHQTVQMLSETFRNWWQGLGESFLLQCADPPTAEILWRTGDLRGMHSVLRRKKSLGKIFAHGFEGPGAREIGRLTNMHRYRGFFHNAESARFVSQTFAFAIIETFQKLGPDITAGQERHIWLFFNGLAERMGIAGLPETWEEAQQMFADDLRKLKPHPVSKKLADKRALPLMGRITIAGMEDAARGWLKRVLMDSREYRRPSPSELKERALPQALQPLGELVTLALLPDEVIHAIGGSSLMPAIRVMRKMLQFRRHRMLPLFGRMEEWGKRWHA